MGFRVVALEPAVRACVRDARKDGLTATGTLQVVAFVDAVGRVIPASDGPRPLHPVLTCVDQALRESDRMGPPPGDGLAKFAFDVTVTALPKR